MDARARQTARTPGHRTVGGPRPRAERRARCHARRGSAASPGQSPTRERSGPRHRPAARRGSTSGARRSRTRAWGSDRRAGRPTGRRAARRSACSSPSESTCSSTSASACTRSRTSRAPERETAPAGGDGAAPPTRLADLRGQAHTVIWLVLDDPDLGQLVHHPRHRRGCHPEPRREIVRRDRRAAASLERVHRLRIVLHRWRNKSLRRHARSNMACLIVLVEPTKPLIRRPAMGVGLGSSARAPPVNTTRVRMRSCPMTAATCCAWTPRAPSTSAGTSTRRRSPTRPREARRWVTRRE